MRTFFWTSALLLACLLTACNSAPTTTTTTSTEKAISVTTTPVTQASADYVEPALTDIASNLVDKKIVFDGKIAELVLQHLMFNDTSAPEKAHYYIDPIEGKYGFSQLVAYSKQEDFGSADSYKGKTLRLHGTMKSMTGKSKGKGKNKTGQHIEYYLLLDKLEIK